MRAITLVFLALIVAAGAQDTTTTTEDFSSTTTTDPAGSTTTTTGPAGSDSTTTTTVPAGSGSTTTTTNAPAQGTTTTTTNAPAQGPTTTTTNAPAQGPTTTTTNAPAQGTTTTTTRPTTTTTTRNVQLQAKPSFLPDYNLYVSFAGDSCNDDPLIAYYFPSLECKGTGTCVTNNITAQKQDCYPTTTDWKRAYPEFFNKFNKTSGAIAIEWYGSEADCTAGKSLQNVAIASRDCVVAAKDTSVRLACNSNTTQVFYQVWNNEKCSGEPVSTISYLTGLDCKGETAKLYCTDNFFINGTSGNQGGSGGGYGGWGGWFYPPTNGGYYLYPGGNGWWDGSTVRPTGTRSTATPSSTSKTTTTTTTTAAYVAPTQSSTAQEKVAVSFAATLFSIFAWFF